MAYSHTRQDTLILSLPIIIDVLTMAGLVTAVPALTSQLAAPAGGNAFLLVVVYGLFLIGTFLLRKLCAPTATNPLPVWLQFWTHPKTRMILAVFFGLIMMTGIAYQLGYFDVFLIAGPEIMDEGGSSSLFVFGPGAWLFLSMFYVFILAFSVKPTIPYGKPGYLGASFFGLLTTNSLLLLTTAQIKTIMPEVSILWLIPIYLLLWLLFAPPRLLYTSQQKGWQSLIVFALLLTGCALQSVF